MTLRIQSQREVWAFTALLTAFAVLIPLIITGAVFSMAPAGFSSAFIISEMVIAGVVPLLMTPPVAYILLDMIRIQNDMIQRVDARMMFDMMTGLFNRTHFLDTMRASQANGPIMIVDADHFKLINDNFGHAVGDEVLRIMANAVKLCVGEAGIVGRLGGEEFCVFMPGKSKADGDGVADAICIAIRQLHPMIAGNNVQLSVSIGCSFHRATAVIGHSLKLADELLYIAKAQGRNRAVCDPVGSSQRLSA
jgi:diguanylate cyclase